MAALHKQSELLWHTTSIYLHPRIHEFAAKITAKLPGNLNVSATDMKCERGKIRNVS